MVPILIFIFVAHCFLGHLIEIYKLKPLSIVMSFILLALSLFFTLGLHYTADYDMYYFMFKTEYMETDILYQYLTSVFKENSLTFHDLHAFHILTATLLFYFIISRFSTNFFYVFLVYIVLDYVHFANQIRYFLGFPLMIIALYSFVKKRYFFGIVLSIVASLSHSSLIVLITFLPLWYFVKKKYFLKVILILSGICLLIVFLLFSLGIGRQIDHFGEYFKQDGVSSFLGGALNGIPYIIMLTVLYFESRKYIKNKPECFKNPKFAFLYTITFYTILFVPASFFMQIAGHRYVMPFMIFYVIFYLFLIEDDSRKSKSLKMIFFSCICFILSLVIYILPESIFGVSHFQTELDYMLKSIPYINYSEW